MCNGEEMSWPGTNDKILRFFLVPNDRPCFIAAAAASTGLNGGL